MDDGYDIPVQDPFGRPRKLHVDLSDDGNGIAFLTPPPAGVAVVPMAQVDALIAALRELRDRRFRETQPDPEPRPSPRPSPAPRDRADDFFGEP